MRLYHSTNPLPRTWVGHPSANGIVHEADLKVKISGRLNAKLLVFEDRKALRNFWRVALNRGNLGKACMGVVSSLLEEHTAYDDNGESTKWMEADPNYFCIIGFSAPDTDSMVVGHESVHAGFAYAKRFKRDFDYRALDFDEENIAYPAGIICANIANELHKIGLWR